MKSIKTRLVSFVTMLVLCIGIFPVTAYSEDTSATAVALYNDGVVDCVFGQNQQGNFQGIINNYITINAKLKMSDNTYVNYPLSASLDTGVETEDGRIKMAILSTGKYTALLTMPKDEYIRYISRTEAIYHFRVDIYSGVQKLDGLTYETTARCISYANLLGQPRTLGGLVCRSQYISSSRSIGLAYIEVTKTTKFYLDSDSSASVKCTVHSLSLDGKISSSQEMSTSSFNLIKGRSVIVFSSADPDGFSACMGQITAVVKASSVTLPATLGLVVGDEAHLSDSMTLLPAETTEKGIWTSDNNGVATVSTYGRVTAIAPGQATITVTYGNVSASCIVTVASTATELAQSATGQTEAATTAPAKAKTLQKQTITVNTKKAKLSKKKTMNLAKYVKVKGNAKLTFTKKSGNKNITITKKGKLTVKKGLKKGNYKIKVKISASATDTYKSASITQTITIKVK